MESVSLKEIQYLVDYLGDGLDWKRLLNEVDSFFQSPGHLDAILSVAPQEGPQQTD